MILKYYIIAKTLLDVYCIKLCFFRPECWIEKPETVSNPTKLYVLHILIFSGFIPQIRNESGCKNPDFFCLTTQNNLKCHTQNHYSGCRLKCCSSALLPYRNSHHNPLLITFIITFMEFDDLVRNLVKSRNHWHSIYFIHQMISKIHFQGQERKITIAYGLTCVGMGQLSRKNYGLSIDYFID